MNYFRLRQPPSGSGQPTTWLEGNHRWRIPPLSCPTCGKNFWADGVAYPAADLDGSSWSGETVAGGQTHALLPDRIFEITQAIGARLPYDLALPPGTNLGAFRGKPEKKLLLDFAWYCSFPFLTEAALGKLRSAGISDLLAVPCEIQYQAAPRSRYLELQIEHEVSLVGDLQPPNGDHSQCAVCGRDNGWLPRAIAVDAATIPRGVSLMRCRQYRPLRIITERFADAIRECKLKGVVIEPVELVWDRRLAASGPPTHITAPGCWSKLAERFIVFEAEKPKRLATRRATPKKRNVSVGASKLGGMPDLPARVRWPVCAGIPLSFLAQVNIADIHGHGFGPHLPSNGLIYFFYDLQNQPWGDEAGDSRGWCVMFFVGEVAALRRRRQHNRFEIEVLPEWPVDFVSTFGEVGPDGIRLTKVDREQMEDTVPGIIASVAEQVPHRKLLGSPDCVQEEMREELHVTAVAAFPHANVRGPEDWTLLLQLDTDPEAGMSWADEGRLYCWIPKEDLAAGDFRHVWFVLQSY